MFLSIKKGDSLVLVLEASDAVVAHMYAALRESYDGLTLNLSFNRPIGVVYTNVVEIIRELEKAAGVIYSDSAQYESSSEVIEDEKIINDINEEIAQIEEALHNENIDDIEITEEIEEPISFEEETETVTIEEAPIIEKEEEEVIEIEESQIEENLDKPNTEEAPVKKAPMSSNDKMLEAIKEQQRNEPLLELEGDKVNTLVYREHLLNYMKLGFTTNMLKKKVKECNDTAEQARLFTFCDKVEKRTEEYEAKFKKIGLTTAQIHTFRMEVIREVKKYADDSIREVCEYLNSLYSLSDKLMENLK
ncbi:MAG: hypothetical protein ACRCYE_02825 [Sarcina sp.]